MDFCVYASVDSKFDATYYVGDRARQLTNNMDTIKTKDISTNNKYKNYKNNPFGHDTASVRQMYEQSLEYK